MMDKNFRQILSGSLLVAGTAIGAGMLGIPLFTSMAGFWPAMAITALCWVFMLCTGLLFLETSLTMPPGSNLLSMSRRYLGTGGSWFTGGMFIFLYYCLLIAYFAAGAPLLGFALQGFFDWKLNAGGELLVFGLIFGTIVAKGAKWIDRSNLILVMGMFICYALMLILGSEHVETSRLERANWSPFLLASPVLFSAFGYHNIIPSLTTYFDKKVRPLRLSIFIGTGMAFVTYMLWQWLVLGSVPEEEIAKALADGRPATWSLQAVSPDAWYFRVGQGFAFFAIVTSLLGVAFSMVDFLGDCLKIPAKGVNRFWLVLLTFAPPYFGAYLNPQIFDRALGVAGGVGEAILNGLIPVTLVWICRKQHKSWADGQLKGGRITLAVLGASAVGVLILEIRNLT